MNFREISDATWTNNSKIATGNYTRFIMVKLHTFYYGHNEKCYSRTLNRYWKVSNRMKLSVSKSYW